MSHASKAAFVTVDEIRETSLFETEEMAAGVLPALYVGKICYAPNGSWPLPFWNGAKVDDAHIDEYMKMAASDAGFKEYLERYIFGESVMA
tara:strand:+ start:199 stop:471 length:273 start_codon:yes stop_codon:yes gene_type:complete